MNLADGDSVVAIARNVESIEDPDAEPDTESGEGSDA
jgi:DNA gyrase subunit A